MLTTIYDTYKKEEEKKPKPDELQKLTVKNEIVRIIDSLGSRFITGGGITVSEIANVFPETEYIFDCIQKAIEDINRDMCGPSELKLAVTSFGRICMYRPVFPILVSNAPASLLDGVYPGVVFTHKDPRVETQRPARLSQTHVDTFLLCESLAIAYDLRLKLFGGICLKRRYAGCGNVPAVNTFEIKLLSQCYIPVIP